MHSEIRICNRALQYLGLAGIHSFSEASREAQILSSIYPIARDELLESFDFSFSTRLERLARIDKKAPLTSYYIYQLPNYCLRVREVFATGEYFFADARTLHSPSTDIFVEMTARITDATYFSSIFTEALVCRIASMIAVALTGDSTKSADYYKQYSLHFEEAQRIDANTNTMYAEQESPWLTTRNR